ncbi:hypothetical protein SMALA_4170 [Streptomyces malaysiensis subsp. malaysiensis]|nr:hypothetical protein SMALA_4170 [Streptomyces malaysiensis]
MIFICIVRRGDQQRGSMLYRLVSGAAQRWDGEGDSDERYLIHRSEPVNGDAVQVRLQRSDMSRKVLAGVHTLLGNHDLAVPQCSDRGLQQWRRILSSRHRSPEVVGQRSNQLSVHRGKIWTPWLSLATHVMSPDDQKGRTRLLALARQMQRTGRRLIRPP